MTTSQLPPGTKPKAVPDPPDDDPAGAGAPEPGDPPPEVPDAPEAGAGSDDGDQEGEEAGQLVFGDKTTLKLAGKQPNRSQVKIRSISRDIRGQLGDASDDENYVFLVMGNLDSVAIVNSRDAGRKVVGKIRRHEVDPFDVQKVPKEMAERWYEELEEYQAAQEEAAA